MYIKQVMLVNAFEIMFYLYQTQETRSDHELNYSIQYTLSCPFIFYDSFMLINSKL